MMVAFKDKVLSQWMHDNVLNKGLVPLNLDPDKAVWIWSTIAQKMTAQVTNFPGTFEAKTGASQQPILHCDLQD